MSTGNTHMSEQSYTIIIDEAQRLAILEALQKSPPAVTEQEADESLEAFGVLLLAKMFAELPENEQEAPGCMHGFCI
jgi:hypothetical protein